MDGKAVEFGTTGYTMGNIFVLYDRSTDSIWYPGKNETLEAAAGSRKGQTIKILDEPAPITLGEWLQAQPDSLVLLPSEEEIARRNRAYLGVRTEEDDGALRITDVGEETPAGLAGALLGDLIVGLNEVEITSRGDLREAMGEYSAGETATLIIERDGETLELLLEFTRR